jgi:hypothetical protein
MPLPTYVVELQFGSSGYIDVTQYVQNVSISRGINRNLDDFSAGQVSVAFVNNERVFDPLNTSSPLWYSAGGYTIVQPAGRIRITSNGVRRFTGFVQDWDFTYDESGFEGTATVTALDMMYRVSNTAFTGGTAWRVESSGERIKTVMNDNGFDAADYAGVDVGHTLIGYDVHNAGDNVLAYLQNVARSEPADFYSNASAVMELKDRSFTNYAWTNTNRYNFVTYPSADTILFTGDILTSVQNVPGENRSGWELIGSQATATPSLYNGFVWRGGTVVNPFVPADSFVGFQYVDYNPSRYAVAGTAYTFAGSVRGAVGTFNIQFSTLDASGVSQVTGSTTLVSASSTAWNRFQLSINDSGVVGGVRGNAVITGGTTFNVQCDGWIVEPAGTSVNYFDGGFNPTVGLGSASTAYEIAWAGTPYASQSGLMTSVATAVSAPTVLTFADTNSQGTAYGNGTGIPFTVLEVVYASEQLYNKVQVVGVNATAVVEDSASQSLYGLRGYSQTDNLTTSTTKPAEIANAFLGEFRLPEYRAQALTVALESLTSVQQTAVLGIEIRDVVRVCFQPSALGTVVDKFYQVLGINSNTDVERDAITLNLASLDNLPFRLDSPYLGVLDTGILA